MKKFISHLGGGLTAALCLYARDKSEVNVAFQMPLYPMIDDQEVIEKVMPKVKPDTNAAEILAYLEEN